jgi:hypothetical protein
MSYAAIVVGVGTVAYGAYQKNEAKKEEKKAEAALKASADDIPAAQAERMKRLKGREALGSEMPGQNAIEQKIGAATASNVTDFKEGGNQANFQNFLAQSLNTQTSRLADLGIKSSQYKLDRSKDVDAGLVGQAGYEQGNINNKRELEKAQLAAALAEKQAGNENIAGGATTGAMAAGGAWGDNG